MIFTAPRRQYGHDFKSRILQLKPALYFDMDEPSGSALVNRGTLGPTFNAAITGTPTYQATPLVRDNGYGMTFTGSPNHASIASSASIGNAQGVHTIGCWASWTSTTTTLSAVCLRATTSATNNGAPLIILLNQPTAGKISAWSAGNAVATTGSTYNDGNPHLIIIAINAAGTHALLWVDGAYIGSVARGTVVSVNLGFAIAANVPSTGAIQHFPGTIDGAFHIPSLTFTDAMALALYNAGMR